MPTLSLQAKMAYYAKARQSNYAASLRLESFDTTPADAEHFGDLNMIHPFRDGIGRAQRILFEPPSSMSATRSVGGRRRRLNGCGPASTRWFSTTAR